MGNADKPEVLVRFERYLWSELFHMSLGRSWKETVTQVSLAWTRIWKAECDVEMRNDKDLGKWFTNPQGMVPIAMQNADEETLHALQAKDLDDLGRTSASNCRPCIAITCNVDPDPVIPTLGVNGAHGRLRSSASSGRSA